LKSKTLATWIAVLAGALGLHRFYLNGLRDGWAWLFPWPTLAGAYGVERMRQFGQDDQLAWLLIPLMGLSITAAMLGAIFYGLMPDEKWDARFNGGRASRPAGWAAVLGVMAALVLGATALMATVAFSGQRYFEYEVEEAHKISR
jgi:hypothetical protein